MSYSMKEYDQEHMARALATSLPISTKMAVELCNWLRGKELAKAKQSLAEVIAQKRPVPIKRFHRELAHRTAIGPGRYPVNASKELLKLVESVESNAQFKGLNTAELVIEHIAAHKAAKSWHFGRQMRRKMKRTTVEIVVKEMPKAAEKEKIQKQEKKHVKK